MALGTVLNRSRQASADKSPAFGGIAERFRRAGELDRAVALCREGLRTFPDHLSARVTLGWALLDLGRHREAREELERVLRRAPDNLAAIRGLAELHDRTENADVVAMQAQAPTMWPPLPPEAQAPVPAAAEAEVEVQALATMDAAAAQEPANATPAEIGSVETSPADAVPVETSHDELAFSLSLIPAADVPDEAGAEDVSQEIGAVEVELTSTQHGLRIVQEAMPDEGGAVAEAVQLTSPADVALESAAESFEASPASTAPFPEPAEAFGTVDLTADAVDLRLLDPPDTLPDEPADLQTLELDSTELPDLDLAEDVLDTLDPDVPAEPEPPVLELTSAILEPMTLAQTAGIVDIESGSGAEALDLESLAAVLTDRDQRQPFEDLVLDAGDSGAVELGELHEIDELETADLETPVSLDPLAEAPPLLDVHEVAAPSIDLKLDESDGAEVALGPAPVADPEPAGERADEAQPAAAIEAIASETPVAGLEPAAEIEPAATDLPDEQDEDERDEDEHGEDEHREDEGDEEELPYVALAPTEADFFGQDTDSDATTLIGEELDAPVRELTSPAADVLADAPLMAAGFDPPETIGHDLVPARPMAMARPGKAETLSALQRFLRRVESRKLDILPDNPRA